MKGWTQQHIDGLGGTPPAPADPVSRMLDEHEATALRTNRGNDGRDFQKEMEQTIGGYNSRRVAMLAKVDPPVRVIWPTDPRTGQKVQRVIFQTNPFLDYVGVWTARHGRALFVEAKSTATHRLPFNGGGGLKSEQVANAFRWRRAGAAVALVWRFNGRACLFTPEMMQAAAARGDKSLVFESGLPVAPLPGTTVLWDFLPVLAEAIWPAEKKTAPPCE